MTTDTAGLIAELEREAASNPWRMIVVQGDKTEAILAALRRGQEAERMLEECDAAIALAESKGLDDGDTAELTTWDEAIARHTARQQEGG